ncbi:NFX1-type zinc finger-containing protein 1 [Halotydeus destructor]|nr:NFX1-type zinc finger-containing protein 1 [Halotydeus destructor]
MQVTVIKNLHGFHRIDLIRLLLVDDDEFGFFDELKEDNGVNSKDPKKMTNILIVFNILYREICEDFEDQYILLKKMFDITKFQDEIMKYLVWMQEEGSSNEDESHCAALQGLWFYLQNLDKALRYDNCEVGFYLKDAFLQFELTKWKLVEANPNLKIKQPKPRKAQRPIDGDLVSDGNEDNDDDWGETSVSSSSLVPNLSGDFRDLSVLPSYDDIHRKEEPFIRKNLTDKSYKNTEHYLDTQFRLLREDFIRPLHQSVQKFIAGSDNLEKLAKDPDLLIYENIEFLGSEIVPRGLIFTVQFNVEKLGRVDWLETSRLLPGSLLCLSANKFKTLFFASVAQREPEDIREGRFCIRIESDSFDFYSLMCDETFVAIESTGYFEAYRHSLKALQLFNSAYAFPLKQYVVDVCLDVKRPAYLTGSEKYNFEDLAYPINKKLVVDEEYGKGHRYRRSLNLTQVDLFNKSGFPWDLMDLDESQFEAFYAAMTKEFAVIQGPPGTGKSYIGLRIVQALLRNKDSWNKTEKEEECRTCPILVLSYKNHALDQFLEGCLNFTKKITRVGGRSESPLLQPYILHEKRQALKKDDIPKSDKARYFLDVKMLKSTMIEIDHIGTMLKQIKNGVVILGKELEKHFVKPVHASQIRLLSDAAFADDDLKGGFIRWMEFDKFINGRENLSDVLGRAKDIQELNGRREALYAKLREASMRENCGQVVTENDDTVSVYSEFVVDKLAQRTSKATNVRGQSMLAMRVMDSDEYARDANFRGEVMTKKMFRKVTNDDLLNQLSSSSSVSKEDRKKIKLIRFLKTLFSHETEKEVMTRKELENIDDVRLLQRENKFRMFNYLVKEYLAEQKLEMEHLSRRVKLLHEDLEHLSTKRNFAACQGCDVIGMTTTGASKYRDLVEMLAPKIVMIEEAAEILEPYLISALTRKTQHVILIGDHKQLRPIAAVHDLSVNYNLEISLFERMVNNRMAFHQLINQHRMRPAISRLLVPHIYEILVNHADVKRYPQVEAMRKKNVFFFTHENLESKYMGHSYCNKREGEFAIELLRFFVLRGVDPARITLLTTYTGQLALIKRELLSREDNRKLFVEKRQYKDKKPLPLEFKMTVASVDSFQGQENDIVIISFVRSNGNKEIGFLSTPNRVCVALSRARHGLYCIGNFEQYGRKSELWSGILSTLREHDQVGPELLAGCDVNRWSSEMFTLFD